MSKICLILHYFEKLQSNVILLLFEAKVLYKIFEAKNDRKKVLFKLENSYPELSQKQRKLMWKR